MHKVLVKKHLANWQNGRKRHRWEANIMKDLWEIGCQDEWWMEIAKMLKAHFDPLTFIMGVVH
jgi:hypothetical protein